MAMKNKFNIFLREICRKPSSTIFKKLNFKIFTIYISKFLKYPSMNFDSVIIKNLFETSQHSDLTLILKDAKEREWKVKVHFIILLMSKCDYFRKMFNFGKEKNKNEIIINVDNVYIAYDFIAEYFYGIESNIGNYVGWKHVLKSITCYNFFLVQIKNEKMERITIPPEGYNSLISIANNINHSPTIIKLLNRCLPNDYDFSCTSEEINDKLVQTIFCECMYFITEYHKISEIHPVAGYLTFSEPNNPYVCVKNMKGTIIIYIEDFIIYNIWSITKKIILYAIKQERKTFILHHLDTGKACRYVAPSEIGHIDFFPDCKIACYKLFNKSSTVFDIIFEDVETNKILRKYHIVDSISKYIPISIPEKCNNIMCYIDANDINIINIIDDNVDRINISKNLDLTFSPNGKIFSYTRINEFNEFVCGIYDINDKCIISESVFEISDFYCANDFLLYTRYNDSCKLRMWDFRKNEHFEIGMAPEPIDIIRSLDDGNLFCTRTINFKSIVWNVSTRTIVGTFSQNEKVPNLSHKIQKFDIMTNKLLDKMNNGYRKIM